MSKVIEFIRPLPKHTKSFDFDEFRESVNKLIAQRTGITPEMMVEWPVLATRIAACRNCRFWQRDAHSGTKAALRPCARASSSEIVRLKLGTETCCGWQPWRE